MTDVAAEAGRVCEWPGDRERCTGQRWYEAPPFLGTTTQAHVGLVPLESPRQQEDQGDMLDLSLAPKRVDTRDLSFLSTSVQFWVFLLLSSSSFISSSVSHLLLTTSGCFSPLEVLFAYFIFHASEHAKFFEIWNRVLVYSSVSMSLFTRLLLFQGCFNWLVFSHILFSCTFAFLVIFIRGQAL